MGDDAVPRDMLIVVQGSGVESLATVGEVRVHEAPPRRTQWSPLDLERRRCATPILAVVEGGGVEGRAHRRA